MSNRAWFLSYDGNTRRQDHSHRNDEADEHDWDAVVPVMGGGGLAAALHPTPGVLILTGERHAESARRTACRLVVGAQGGQTRVEDRVLVPGPAAVDVAFQHRRGGIAGIRRRIHGLDGVGARDVSVVGQALPPRYGLSACARCFGEPRVRCRVPEGLHGSGSCAFLRVFWDWD